jgi:branched-chain amino acid transport system permease protein
MVAAAIAVGMIAFVMGYPILKLKGHYLAMGTLAFGMIFYIVFNEFQLTGGPSGLPGIPSLSLGGFSFDSDIRNYYLIWSVTLFTILISVNIARSRIGRALRAIHDSEVAARVMGVNARLLKVQIFALSAALSSLAGSLYAHQMMFIGPSSFGFMFSVELVTMVIIGGMGTIYGPLLGAAILVMLPIWLHSFQDYDVVVFGALLMTMVIFLPGGLVSLPQILWQHIQKLRKEKNNAPA